MNPIIEPITDHIPIQPPYSKLIVSLTKFTTVALKAVNKTRYIPVEPATLGLTPRLSNAGLYMLLPPKPKAPAIHLPKNP